MHLCARYLCSLTIKVTSQNFADVLRSLLSVRLIDGGLHNAACCMMVTRTKIANRSEHYNEPTSLLRNPKIE